MHRRRASLLPTPDSCGWGLQGGLRALAVPSNPALPRLIIAPPDVCRLGQLDLRHCAALEHLRLALPHLTSLCLAHCPLLISVQLACPVLR